MRQPQGQISRPNWTMVVCCSESKLGVAGFARRLKAQLGLMATRRQQQQHTRTLLEPET